MMNKITRIVRENVFDEINKDRDAKYDDNSQRRIRSKILMI